MTEFTSRVQLPQVADVDEEQKWNLSRASAPDPEHAALINLSLWAMEQPKFADFIYLPDREAADFAPAAIEHLALQLLEDTYGEGVSRQVLSMSASHIGGFLVRRQSGIGLVHTWPLYQARALQYASVRQLPLVSDDPLCLPPLPDHPEHSRAAKGLAQQLAVEALSLVLPSFRSVEPSQIAEFREAIQPLVPPFRREMATLTGELGAAFIAGASDEEIRSGCSYLVESRVLPALQDLSKQLTDPIKPYHKIALDLTEAALAAASATSLQSLAIGWAIFRGAKIASDYAQLYVDREGKKKSGLSFY